jgi:hypothetical protein
MIHKCQEKGVSSRRVAIARDLKAKDLDYKFVSEKDRAKFDPNYTDKQPRPDSNQPPFLHTRAWLISGTRMNNVAYGVCIRAYEPNGT